MASLKNVIACFAVALFMCSLGVADEPQRSNEAKPTKHVTLMGMLSEWMYPESRFNGAQSGDAAVSDISAIKSKAVLTTTDSVDKVMDFYRRKLNVDGDGNNLDEKEGDRITTNRSVLIQHVSGKAESSLYVIVINGTKSSTTLVVSGVDDDGITRIAWSNYRQLWP